MQPTAEKVESKNGTAIVFGSIRLIFYFLAIFVTYDYLARSSRADAENVFSQGYFVEWLQSSLIIGIHGVLFFRCLTLEAASAFVFDARNVRRDRFDP